MKIIVTGGRDFTDMALFRRVLDSLMWEPHVQLVSGDAKGADQLARSWPRLVRIGFGVKPTVVFRADWDKHGPAAGPIRNAEMIRCNTDADLVLAFPGGRGTADCVKKAHAAGLLVLKVEP